MQLRVDENTILRTWEEADAPALFALVDANREMLLPWLPWVPNVKTVNDSLEFIKTSSSDPNIEKGFEMGIWHNSELAGCLGLHEVSKEHRKTSLGYWLGRKFQGRGIMTKSVNRLIDYCFDELKVNRVELRAATENLASQSVAKRLGFTQEGILREAEMVNGRFLDNCVFSLLKKDNL